MAVNKFDPRLYKEGRRLGEGGYGEVFRYDLRSLEGVLELADLGLSEEGRPKAVAVKKLKKSANDKRIKTEIEALKDLSGHKNMITYYCSWQLRSGSILLYMELCKEDLAAYAKSRQFTPKELRALSRQIAEGIEYMHGRKIVHRDLKPANIMMTDDGTPKVGDFGLAQVFSKDVEIALASMSAVGTQEFMAPEMANAFFSRNVLVGEQFKADVFSLGVIIFYLQCKHTPFSLLMLVDGAFDAGPTLNKSIPGNTGLRHLLSGMLKREPERRVDMHVVMQVLMYPVGCNSNNNSMEPILRMLHNFDSI